METSKIVGVTNISVEYNNVAHDLPLLVVKGSGPALFGRDWLKQIKLDWQELKNLSADSDIDNCYREINDII